MKLVEGFRLRDVMGQATVIGEGVGQVGFHTLITLNESAAYRWESAAGKEFDIDTLADLLIERYSIDEALAKKDAEAIASKWVEIGLAE